MTKVKKRSGELQEFDRTRLLRSMKNAGADEQVATSIAEKVQVAEGVTTFDLRQFVADELRKVNVQTGEAYARTLRLSAKGREDLPTQAARVPKAIDRIPDVRPGQPARVRHGEKRMEVRIEPALDTREVWLNRKDFETLGVPEGTRVAVRFLGEAGGTPPGAPTSIRQDQPGGPTIPRGR